MAALTISARRRGGGKVVAWLSRGAVVACLAGTLGLAARYQRPGEPLAGAEVSAEQMRQQVDQMETLVAHVAQQAGEQQHIVVLAPREAELSPRAVRLRELLQERLPAAARVTVVRAEHDILYLYMEGLDVDASAEMRAEYMRNARSFDRLLGQQASADLVIDLVGLSCSFPPKMSAYFEQAPRPRILLANDVLPEEVVVSLEDGWLDEALVNCIQTDGRYVARVVDSTTIETVFEVP